MPDPVQNEIIPKIKPRRAWLAGLLSFFCIGLGQVYNGQLIKGLVLYLVYLGLALISALLGLMKSPAGALLDIFLFIAVMLITVIDAIVVARQRQDYRLKSYNHYMVYAAIIVILTVVLGPAPRQWSGCGFLDISSDSLKPTLVKGDHFVVDLQYFSERQVARGDLVVFKFPEDKDKDFVKRVIGLPGETVEVRDKQVLINGKAISDPWAHHTDRVVLSSAHPPRDNFGPRKVPPDHYFVLGDNRDQSYDSRFWFKNKGGFVPREDILGKALYIYWSDDWSRIGKIIE